MAYQSEYYKNFRHDVRGKSPRYGRYRSSGERKKSSGSTTFNTKDGIGFLAWMRTKNGIMSIKCFPLGRNDRSKSGKNYERYRVITEIKGMPVKFYTGFKPEGKRYLAVPDMGVRIIPYGKNGGFVGWIK